MSTLLAIMSGIANVISGRGSNEEGPTGAEAVRTAVNEIETIRDRQFTATLGEPDIVENYGQFFKDPKVIIPVRDAPFEGANRLVFDLPKGRNDSRAVFNDLLDLFGLSLEDLEDLDGEVVPMTFIGGNASVMWDEISDEADKGTEKNPYTEEDVEEALEGMEDESDEDNDSSVTVEETTISADDADEEGDDA